MSQVDNCAFCKIVAGESSETNIEFDNERIVIFKDLKPASDYHYLAVPKIHIDDGRKLTLNDKDLSKATGMGCNKTVHRFFIFNTQIINWLNFWSFTVLEMQNQLRELIRKKGVVLSDVSFGFHWPPFVSVHHLHMHAIAPASRMTFVNKCVFKPANIWYRTVSFSISLSLSILLKSSISKWMSQLGIHR